MSRASWSTLSADLVQTSWSRMLVRAAVTALCLAMVGCGYHVLQPASGKDRKVSVAVFKNRTFRPNLEVILANSMIAEFASREGLTAAERREADFILEGLVLSYGVKAVSYSASDTVKEYRATVRLEAVLREAGTHRVVWKGTLSEFADYPASDLIALQQNSEDAALVEICRKLAQEVYFKVSADF